jgi:prepilin-type N-terminal cleavage/methylation domain-containing protein
MFKLLKSKKGFTLVELMIVVVIMAILVAVAVPIFSAVTSNARKKTCAANQREIQSQISNAEMSDVFSIDADGTLTLKTDANGDPQDWEGDAVLAKPADGSAATAAQGLAEVKKLFQKVPYCPEKNATIKVEFEEVKVGASEESSVKVVTSCSIEGHEGYKAPVNNG